MPTIISTILIAISAIVIIAIIIKKLPALAILDVNNMAGAKEAKFKDEIIKQRLERDLSRMGGHFARLWMRIYKQMSNLVRSTQARLKKKRQTYRIEKKRTIPKKQDRVKNLFLSFRELMEKELFDQAEENLIEIIGLDEKNLQAFFELGELYREQKKRTEATQTLEYALKLAKQHRDDDDVMGDVSIQQIYFSLALNEKESDNIDAALENIGEALDLEQNNPRYLDLILDLSIMKKDKELAMEYFNKLATVNPENNKLAELKEKIEAL